MFLPFFENLRKSGLPVSLREYLTFLEAMSANLVTYDIEDVRRMIHKKTDSPIAKVKRQQQRAAGGGGLRKTPSFRGGQERVPFLRLFSAREASPQSLFNTIKRAIREGDGRGGGPV